MKKMKMDQAIKMIWNDARIDCQYNCPNESNEEDIAEPCDSCLIQTYEDKWNEMSDEFIDSVIAEGIQSPIVIRKTDNGHYAVSNGHHRLIIAMALMMKNIPVFEYKAGCLQDWPDSRPDLPGSIY